MPPVRPRTRAQSWRRASDKLGHMNDTTPRRTALVTGASAGIGAALSRVFAEHGFDLVLTARREDRLRELALSLSRQHGIRTHVVVADLADPAAPANIMNEISTAGLSIDALVNNAGYGRSGSYLDSSWREHEDFLHVMVVAVAALTHLVLPGMIRRQYGRIINVASVAGLVPATSGHTLYGATKSLVVMFSQSLAGEVGRLGVNVTALCPGFTYSEFHDVNGMREKVSRLPTWLWLDADQVARAGYDAVMRGRAVEVPGGLYKAIVLLARYAPQWLVQAVNRRQARHFRRT
jgi:short-subunit dehydrogenase